MNAPQVLGLPVEEARARLLDAGFTAADVKFSGRRKDGAARVIRQLATEGGVELIASFFKLPAKQEE